MIHKALRLTRIASAVTALLGLSAQAGIYPFTFSDSGSIPNDGSFVFSVEEAIKDLPGPIESVQLILRFTDSASLSGTSDGIQGRLNLGVTESAPTYAFRPTVSYVSDAGERIYDVTFHNFDSQNPNATWGLVLYDNNAGANYQNYLNGWTMNITAVPESVNLALGVFAVILLAAAVLRNWPGRERIQSWWNAANRWIDAV